MSSALACATGDAGAPTTSEARSTSSRPSGWWPRPGWSRGARSSTSASRSTRTGRSPAAAGSTRCTSCRRPATPRCSPAASSTPTTTSSCRCRAPPQWDSLAHVYYDDQIYNGFPSSDVTVVGAFHCTIDKIAKGVAGRGVLLDIARLKGVDWLELGDVDHP